MVRILVAAIILSTTSSALAQTLYNPKVAYTVLSGQTPYLYLANEDGSRAVRITAGVTGINGIDFAPGGGRIAFSDYEGLKVLDFSASDAGIKVLQTRLLVPTATTPRLGSPDFSADGSRLLYYQSGNATFPAGYRVVATAGGTAPVFLHQGSGLGVGRWLPSPEMGNAFAFLNVNSSSSPTLQYEIWTVLLDKNDNVTSAGPVLSTATQTFKSIDHFDVSRTRNALLIPTMGTNDPRIIEWNLNLRQITYVGPPGFHAHYNADDSKIVFRNINYKGSVPYIYSVDVATGVVKAIASKSTFGVVDAQP